MLFHQVEDQDTTHLVQVQWMLEKREQHLRHDKEPEKQRSALKTRNAILPVTISALEYY